MEVLNEKQNIIPNILPHGKVFPIQVGTRLFQLSGASLLSDAPSYFTLFFLNPLNFDETLFIDRNPVVFEKIYNHLQGYHLSIADDVEFIHIWLDAEYFSLPRLRDVLTKETLFASVGNICFRIPRMLIMKPGNSPNYFLLNLDTLATHAASEELKRTSLRPPPLRPVLSVNRSPKLFADILELLWGNHSVIRDDVHRKLLIKECRYFRFLELEQKILKHKVLENPISGNSEIVMDLFDLSGQGIVSFSTGFEDEQPLYYRRPFVSPEPSRVLIVQISSSPSSEAKLVIQRDTELLVAVFTKKIALTLTNILQAGSVHLDSEGEYLTMLCNLANASVNINGMDLRRDWYNDFLPSKEPEDAKKRKITSSGYVEFQMTRSLWRILQRGNRAILQAVSIEAFSDVFLYNRSVSFL